MISRYWLIGLFAIFSVHLHGLELSSASQFGASTPSIGWEKVADDELIGYHGVTVLPGISVYGIGLTLGWASMEYLPEPNLEPLMPYWYWGVNILHGVYPMVGLGVEYSIDKTHFISLQTVNLNGVILGVGFRR